MVFNFNANYACGSDKKYLIEKKKFERVIICQERIRNETHPASPNTVSMAPRNKMTILERLRKVVKFSTVEHETPHPKHGLPLLQENGCSGINKNEDRFHVP